MLLVYWLALNGIVCAASSLRCVEEPTYLDRSEECVCPAFSHRRIPIAFRVGWNDHEKYTRILSRIRYCWTLSGGLINPNRKSRCSLSQGELQPNETLVHVASPWFLLRPVRSLFVRSNHSNTSTGWSRTPITAVSVNHFLLLAHRCGKCSCGQSEFLLS